MDFNESYWDNRYKLSDTGWDLGEVSPPLKAYFDQLINKSLKILIPGGGNSHEAEYLHLNGFDNVFVIDLSQTALLNIKTRVPSFPEHHLIHGDFFDINITFDLIIEQTFFCAINPILRTTYAEKAFKMLNTNGKIAGLLFNAPLNKTHPPFGGSKTEYKKYFHPNFDVLLMDESHNSHHSRKGRELFIKIKKK